MAYSGVVKVYSSICLKGCMHYSDVSKDFGTNFWRRGVRSCAQNLCHSQDLQGFGLPDHTFIIYDESFVSFGFRNRFPRLLLCAPMTVISEHVHPRGFMFPRCRNSAAVRQKFFQNLSLPNFERCGALGFEYKNPPSPLESYSSSTKSL